jgi:hypothetical protein
MDNSGRGRSVPVSTKERSRARAMSRKEGAVVRGRVIRELERAGNMVVELRKHALGKGVTGETGKTIGEVRTRHVGVGIASLILGYLSYAKAICSFVGRMRFSAA